MPVVCPVFRCWNRCGYFFINSVFIVPVPVVDIALNIIVCLFFCLFIEYNFSLKTVGFCTHPLIISLCDDRRRLFCCFRFYPCFQSKRVISSEIQRLIVIALCVSVHCFSVLALFRQFTFQADFYIFSIIGKDFVSWCVHINSLIYPIPDKSALEIRIFLINVPVFFQVSDTIAHCMSILTLECRFCSVISPPYKRIGIFIHLVQFIDTAVHSGPYVNFRNISVTFVMNKSCWIQFLTEFSKFCPGISIIRLVSKRP